MVRDRYRDIKRFNFENTIAAGASILTVVAPKFCCWGSAVAAMSGGVSYLAWVYPLRPYLFGSSFLLIGYSFYKAYKPKKENNAGCVCDQKRSGFLKSKTFTWIVAVFVFIMFIISYFVL